MYKDRTQNYDPEIYEEYLIRDTPSGIGDLQDIVATRRRRFIGHVLRLPTSKPASLEIDWTPEGGCRRWGRPKRTWRGHVQGRHESNECQWQWHS